MRVVLSGEDDAEGQHAVGSETRIDGGESCRAPDHQAPDDEQHEGGCDFAGDQHLPRPQHTGATGVTKPAHQRAGDRLSRAAPRGEPRERGANDEDEHREQRKRRPADRRRGRRQIEHTTSDQHAMESHAEDGCKSATRDCQREMLDHQLTPQAASGRAQCRAHGELGAAHGGAHGQQAGDVETGDEQNGGNRTDQHAQADAVHHRSVAL